MIPRRVGQPVEDIVAETYHRCSIHNGMFTHYARVGIIEDDELARFVDPSVLQTDGDTIDGVSMP